MSELLTLPVILAAIIIVSLNAYVLLAGADFGGGVWDFFASGPRRASQRALIADAIGPVWEANHVWLILVVVLLFTCFPGAFAALSITLHIPLLIMLLGIVLRGAAFTFRTYDSQRDEVQRRWGRIFAIASLITPLVLGVCVGAIAAGRVRGEAANGFATATFVASYITPWLTGFGLAIGATTLALFAHLAAVYLTVEARDPSLQDDFRRRALIAQGAALAAAALALLLARRDAPGISRGLLEGWHAVPLLLGVGLAAAWTAWSLVHRRFHAARIGAAAQASAILWGWPLAQFPYLLPPDLTITAAAAPATTLRLVLITLGVGALLLFPSLAYLFRVFKSSHHVPAERSPSA
jgi:cytochrome d ubiquinol oxidase subunit II